MKQFTYKLYKKSEYEIQIKEGRKVREKIVRCSDGWIVGGCVLCPTLEHAVEYALRTRKQMMEAFSGEVEINLANCLTDIL